MRGGGIWLAEPSEYTITFQGWDGCTTPTNDVIAAGGSEVPQERVGERVPGERFYGFTLLWIICFAVRLGSLG